MYVVIETLLGTRPNVFRHEGMPANDLPQAEASPQVLRLPEYFI
jgi:hypothetical protein